MSTAAERVKLGAELLDEKRPDWAHEIDLRTLNLGDFRSCVLAQLHEGSYTAGRTALDIWPGCDYGFDEAPSEDITYAELQDLWVIEIEARRA